MSVVPVVVTYKIKPGVEKIFEELLREHWSLLAAEGLATERQALLLRKQGGGEFYEFFEWASEDAKDRAHTNEEVRRVWEKIEEVTLEGGINSVACVEIK